MITNGLAHNYVRDKIAEENIANINPVWLTFLDLCDRANLDPVNLKLAEKWLRSQKQWAQVAKLPNIEDDILRATLTF